MKAVSLCKTLRFPIFCYCTFLYRSILGVLYFRLCFSYLRNLKTLSYENSTINKIDAELNVDKTEHIKDLTYNQSNSVVTSQDATEVASAFWADINSATRAKVDNPEYELSTIYSGNEPQMYVFNFKNGGFVVVSATKDYYPILAYSEDGTFPVGEEKSGLKVWLNETKQAIFNSAQQESSVKGAIRMMWNQYELQDQTMINENARATNSSASLALLQRLEYYYIMTSGSGGWTFVPLSQAANAFAQYGLSVEYQYLCNRAQYNNSALDETLIGWRIERVDGGTYGPFLNTAWHQGNPFNADLNHKVGCGAIAVSQLMNYYKQPATFTVGGTTYNWSNITDIPSPGSNHSKLVKYVYYNIGTSYWDLELLDFAFTRPNDLEYGLETMGYNVTQRDHNSANVINELKANRPVIMLGSATNVMINFDDIEYIGNSHYWVCDGLKDVTYYFSYFTEWQPYGNGTMVPGWYSFESPSRIESNNATKSFHMNWGWNEYGANHYNGWFLGESTDSGNGNYIYNRKDFLITVDQ